MLIKKPMLAGKIEDPSEIKFPVLWTPKLDGIRCLTNGSTAISRTFKPIPNQHIQKVMSGLLSDLDGELITYNPDGSMRTFNQIQGDVMSEDGEPDFKFWVFDYVKDDIGKHYIQRIEDLKKLKLPSFCHKLLPKVATNLEELTEAEEKALADYFEGLMLRSIDGPYKEGRTTTKQGWLLKMKRFQDSEAKVIGFVEQLTNENEAEKDELGHTKRSTHKDNMVPNGHLGKFIAVELGDVPWKGKEIVVGGAKDMTKEMRKEIWENQDKFMGKVFTYSYQAHGIKDLPRLPIWKGWRDDRDR